MGVQINSTIRAPKPKLKWSATAENQEGRPIKATLNATETALKGSVYNNYIRHVDLDATIELLIAARDALVDRDRLEEDWAAKLSVDDGGKK